MLITLEQLNSFQSVQIGKKQFYEKNGKLYQAWLNEFGMVSLEETSKNIL